MSIKNMLGLDAESRRYRKLERDRQRALSRATGVGDRGDIHAAFNRATS